MTAADVKLVVNQVGAGSVSRDEVEAVGAGGAGSFEYGLAAHSDGGGGGSCINGLRGFADLDSLGNASDVEREVAQRSRVGRNAEIGDIFAEAVVRDADGVVAGGNGVHLKFTVGVADSFALPIRLLGLQQKMRSGNRPMLNVVDDTANGAEDSGECRKNRSVRNK